MKRNLVTTTRFFIHKYKWKYISSFLLLVFISHSYASDEGGHQVDGMDDQIDVDILQISPSIKAELDSHFKAIKDPMRRIAALHKLMFDSTLWGVQYSADHTLTAQNTFEQKKGNCLSLAALYIASARHLGMRAKFQSVEVPREEDVIRDIKVVRKHVNTVVYLHDREVYVEFLSAGTNVNSGYEVRKVLTDNMAFAQYHNNLAVETLSLGNEAVAERHLVKALDYYSKFDYIWSNYGVFEKKRKNLLSAEKNYKKALKLNNQNYTALVNLYVLLSESGRFKEADKLAKKLPRRKKDAPIYFEKIARIALFYGRPKEALKQVDRGLVRGKSRPSLHYLKVQAFSEIGNIDAALSSIQKAIEFANSEADLEVYYATRDALKEKYGKQARLNEGGSLVLR